MCALRDNAARYLRARSRPVLVSCEESQRVEISLSRSLTPSPLVTCTCICPAHHLSGTLHLRLRALSIRPQYICAYMTNKRPKEEKKRKKKSAHYETTPRAICVSVRDLYLYPVKSLKGLRSLFLALSLPLPL